MEHDAQAPAERRPLYTERWFIVATLITALFVLPLFVPRFLPFIDLAPHLAELNILTNYDDPQLGYSRFYELGDLTNPYAAHRHLLRIPAALVGADYAYRIYLALYLIGCPLAIFWLLRRMGRSPWPGFLVFVGLYSFPLAFGWVTYLVGCSLVLWGYLLLERWLARPGWRGAAALTLLALLLFLAHFQALLYWAVTALLITICWGLRHGRGVLRRVLILAGTMLPWLGLMALSASRVLTTERADMPSFRFPDPAERLSALPELLGCIWRDPFFYVVLLLLTGIALLAVLLRPTSAADRAETPGWRELLWRRRYFLVCAAYLAGAFLLPERVQEQYYVASRFPAMALLLLPLALSDAAVWSVRLIGRLIAATVATLGIFIGLQLLNFDAEAVPFARVIEAIPHGARTRCQIANPDSRVLSTKAYRHFCGYLLLERGGLNGFFFRGIGIDYKRRYQMPQMQLYRWQESPQNFAFERYGDNYDYFVVRCRKVMTEFDKGGPLAPYVQLVRRSWPWRVYRRVRSFKGSGL